MTLTVPCLFGLEALVADEMKRLQLNNVRAENGRVHCEGSMADIARLNINLRCGARVLMELGSFPAGDFEALFQGVLALPWEDFIPRDGEFPVKGYSLPLWSGHWCPPALPSSCRVPTAWHWCMPAAAFPSSTACAWPMAWAWWTATTAAN